MNIVFVYSMDDVQSFKAPLRSLAQVQFGISYISSFLKKNGHNTKLIVLSKVFGNAFRSVIDKYVEEFSPKIFCFTAVNSEYDFIASVAEYVKAKYPDRYLVIGVSHATLNPGNVMADSFDALCVGEGEMPLAELVSQYEKSGFPSGIEGLWIRRGDKVEKNAPRHFLQRLDDLPFPDRGMWKDWTEEQSGAGISVLLGRGCPYECAYCCNKSLKKISGGAYVRFRSPENVIAEIKNILDDHPENRYIYFQVESFLANVPWANDLCAKLEQLNSSLKEPLSFDVNLRIPDKGDFGGLLRSMYKAGFKYINIGLESGSERIRREVLCRDYSNEQFISFVRLAKEAGLKVNIFNMIGIPGETPTDFEETVRINRICRPDKHYTGIFFPYEGTELYSLCKEKGLISGNLNFSMERKTSVLDLPGFGKRRIKKSYVLFDYYIYKGYKPLPEILARVFTVWVTSDPYLNLLFRQLVRLPILRALRRKLS